MTARCRPDNYSDEEVWLGAKMIGIARDNSLDPMTAIYDVIDEIREFSSAAKEPARGTCGGSPSRSLADPRTRAPPASAGREHLERKS